MQDRQVIYFKNRNGILIHFCVCDDRCISMAGHGNLQISEKPNKEMQSVDPDGGPYISVGQNSAQMLWPECIFGDGKFAPIFRKTITRITIIGYVVYFELEEQAKPEPKKESEWMVIVSGKDVPDEIKKTLVSLSEYLNNL